VKSIRLSIIWSVWSLLLTAACQPLEKTNAPASTKTESSSFSSATSSLTNTPEILLTPTSVATADNCTPDTKLPDPDIPENYIGWKPGVDFSALYAQENTDGDYMYWESILGGYTDVAIAGYKRSDNSYIIFLEKLVCYDIHNDRVYEVVDAIRTRVLSEEEDMAPINFECFRFDEDGDEEVLAIVSKTTGNAVLAWSMDGENNDIQETSLEGIACFPFGIIAPSK
jgi:hypothetical protein